MKSLASQVVTIVEHVMHNVHLVRNHCYIFVSNHMKNLR